LELLIFAFYTTQKMAKERLTENIAEQTPAGGVLVGKRSGQTMIHNKGSLSGYLVGKTHAKGGIKAVNKATGQPLEMQGGEVVITAPAVSDQTKREFEGKMMTNREILSEINSRGGGVSFANGGDIPAKLKYTGASYNYGGKTMSDHDIYMHINGGHLAKGKTLKQIAKMHDVELLDIEKQVKMGMKAESEHTSSKREQLKIVKDHLFENPKYYTLLKKAGLKKGGIVKKEDLAKDADKGDTPARDLNNYNDLMDLQADGAVGGDNGLAMANGGDLSELDKHFDLGGDISMPAVQLIKIKRVDNGAYYDLKGLEFRSFIDFSDVVKDSFLDNSKAPVAIIFTVNDEAKEMGILCKNAKNTVLNFNPITGTVKDFEKQIQRRYPRSAKNFYWENWLESKVLLKVSSVVQTNTNQSNLVQAIKINYADPATKNETFIFTASVEEFLKYLILMKNARVENVMFELSVNGFVVKGTTYGLSITDDSQDTWALPHQTKINPSIATQEDVLEKLRVEYPDYDFSKFAGALTLKTTGQANASKSNMIVDSFVLDFLNPITGINETRKSQSITELLADIITESIAHKLDSVYLLLTVDGYLLQTTTEKLQITDGKAFSYNVINPYHITKEILYDKLISLYPNFDFSKVKDAVSGIKTPAKTSKITDLSNTKIWIGDNPELSKAVQEKAFELGWTWNIQNPKTIIDTVQALVFTKQENITHRGFKNGNQSKKDFDLLNEKEIFASDLLDSAPTSTNVIDPVFSTEVPDRIIDFSGIARDLPPAVLILAFKRAYEAGKEPKDVDLNSSVTKLGFTFSNTDEGFHFWEDIYLGKFTEFKERYGKYGEKLKDAVLGLKTPIQSPKITDLSNTKIWIGDNPELSRAVQEKAFELGWAWNTRENEVQQTDATSLFFNERNKIFSSSRFTKQGFGELEEQKEIFASDLFDSAPTVLGRQSVSQPKKADVPLTPEQELAKKFVADDFQLRKNDLLVNATKLEEARNDLDALSKLLPSFQASKFAVERASIIKEMARLNKKITYEGFIRSNEEASKGDDLFTPQGLLDYYYTQTTQNPTAELEPACELPTPNGAKSKLPMGAYLNVRTPQFKKWFGDWEKAYETGNYVNCSKMIDEETKEPKIYFHGVRKYVPNFGQMSNMGKGVVRPYGSFEPPTFPASYFADNESYANFYGGIADNLPTPSPDYKPFIYKVFLSVKNPISLLPLDFELSYKDLMDYVFVAYGVRLKVNNALLSQLDNDIDKKHPIWIYIRRDIGLIETLKDYGYDALFQTGDIPVFDKNGEVVSDRSKFIKDTEYLTFYPNQVKSATVKKSFYFDFFNDIRFKKGGYVRI
jgi:hypothetical protein